jgi:hypothetical protein
MSDQIQRCQARVSRWIERSQHRRPTVPAGQFVADDASPLPAIQRSGLPSETGR